MDDTSTGYEAPISKLADELRRAQRVVALTGAGISTESGIPDFRGPNGIWTKDPKAERLASLQHYMSDREVRVQAWQARLDHPGWNARPNPGHEALAALERQGKLHTLITQNVDGLHEAAGNSREIIIEIHGTMREVVCMSCAERAPMTKALDRVRAGEEDPECRTCGGILKSATISFGQNLVPADLDRARRAAETSDVFIAIGTSLTVYPVAYLPLIAREAGARVVILNDAPTPLDERADLVLNGRIGELLPAVARGV